MPKKSYRPEQIINKLREAEVLLLVLCLSEYTLIHLRT